MASHITVMNLETAPPQMHLLGVSVVVMALHTTVMNLIRDPHIYANLRLPHLHSTKLSTASFSSIAEQVFYVNIL